MRVEPAVAFLSLSVLEFTRGLDRDFIVQVLLKCLPGMGESAAKEIADKAKKAGQAVVGAWIFEMAEAYCDSLRTSGLVADIQLE